MLSTLMAAAPEMVASIPIVSWEQVVLVGLFFAYQYFSNRDIKNRVKKMDTSLHQNNGGGSVKDGQDRIEKKLDELLDKDKEVSSDNQ